MKNSRLFFHLFSLAVITMLGLTAYANTFHSPFTFDDMDNIVENHSLKIKELSLSGLKNAATEGPSPHRWLPNLSFAINYYLDGLNVFGYHVVNLFIHILSAFFLYGLASTVLSLPLAGKTAGPVQEIALAAAILWAVHPVQTNAVTYIVQRMTSMAALFFLSALFFYIRGRLVIGSTGAATTKKLGYYGSGLTAGLMALASKENTAMLPIMVVAFELFFLRDTFFTRNIKKGIILITASVVLVILLALIYGADLQEILSGYGQRNFTLPERLLTETRVVWQYLSLLILPLPSRLNLTYDFELSRSLFAPLQTGPAILGIVVLVGLIPYLFSRLRLAAFAIFWFLGNLVIESSVYPLEILFEHRLYLPSTFLFLAGVSLFYRLNATRPQAARITLLLVVGMLTFFTWQRNGVWATEISLWSDVITKSPGNARAYINLGQALIKAKDYPGAEKALLTAISFLPEQGIAYYNLAQVYERQNRIPEALTNLNKALAYTKEDQRLAKVHNSLAMIFRKLKNYPLALAESNLALSLNPYLLEAQLTLGITQAETGDHEKAIRTFEQAREKGLDTVDLYNNWGVSCYSLGLPDKAIEYLEHAVRLAPDHAESHYNLGIAYSSIGRIEEARREMALAIQLDKEGGRREK